MCASCVCHGSQRLVQIRSCVALKHLDPPLQVKGDAFIARIFDDENDFKRMDFTLSEVMTCLTPSCQHACATPGGPSMSLINLTVKPPRPPGGP